MSKLNIEVKMTFCTFSEKCSRRNFYSGGRKAAQIFDSELLNFDRAASPQLFRSWKSVSNWNSILFQLELVLFLFPVCRAAIFRLSRIDQTIYGMDLIRAGTGGKGLALSPWARAQCWINPGKARYPKVAQRWFLYSKLNKSEPEAQSLSPARA